MLLCHRDFDWKSSIRLNISEQRVNPGDCDQKMNMIVYDKKLNINIH
jgi:hypothetical protein